MALFTAIVAALGVGSPPSLVTANWDNISFSGDREAYTASAAAVSFSGGGSRDLQVNFSETKGGMLYSKNGGAQVSITTGGLINVVTTDTIAFTYRGSAHDVSFTVTVLDFNYAYIVDTFTVDYTYTGGGGPPP